MSKKDYQNSDIKINGVSLEQLLFAASSMLSFIEMANPLEPPLLYDRKTKVADTSVFKEARGYIVTATGQDTWLSSDHSHDQEAELRSCSCQCRNRLDRPGSKAAPSSW